jgi:hypothetical protein
LTDTKKYQSYVVVERDHRGWSIVGKLYRNRVLASMASANIENSMVLSARRKRLHLEAFGGQSEQKTVINVDWSACTGTGRERGEQWYAVRVAPGAQRMARPLPIAANATEKDLAEAERRRGETIVERQFRQEGIDVYMPAFWEEVRTHRGHKLRERRMPLLVGYAFIRRDPGAGFAFLEDIDGVIDVISVKQVPCPMAETDIRFLMIQMFDREQARKFQKAQVIEEARFKRRQTLNAELGRHLPKGRGRTVSLRVYADSCIAGMDEEARKRVMGIISDLDALEKDSSLDDFRKAV